MIIILSILLIFTLIVIAFKEREIRHLKKERDYFHEVDDENERLRKKLNEK